MYNGNSLRSETVAEVTREGRTCPVEEAFSAIEEKDVEHGNKKRKRF